MGRGRTNVVIVNRMQSQVQVPWQEAEQLLNHETLALVAPAPELAFQAADAGQPMVTFQPTSIVATQTVKLAEELAARVRTLASTGPVS
jgi:MinD-like ATPase involved in chromosome partitioning or flagellar assembly